MEFGERLIARMDIAITELVKNSYDADSGDCRVWLENQNGDGTLNIQDEGHGITLAEFRSNWLRIATGEKEKRVFSRSYERRLTGAKGVGRFAVRYLGKHLKLVSVAEDLKRECKTQLTADFSWPDFKAGVDLNKVPIPYLLEEVSDSTQVGTHLIISDLIAPWTDEARDRAKQGVLKITSPLRGLDAGKYARLNSEGDPGFEVIWAPPGSDVESEVGQTADVLKYSLAQIKIDLEGSKVNYEIKFLDKEPKFFDHTLNTQYLNGLHADIRFLPWRGGVFARIPKYSGFNARSWVVKNCGIAIIDHGFRVPPYGESGNDWLRLGIDKATNRRKWRSDITQEKFPSEKYKKFPASLHPALHLPHNNQVVGAVFLESDQTSSELALDKLLPSMDRQGFVDNAAFRQLHDIIRAGLELLAIEDLRQTLVIADELAKAEKVQFKREIRAARTEIEQNVEIPTRVKTRLVSQFKKLETGYAEIEQYHSRARESLEMMGTIGVVAGFVAHENQRLVQDMEQLQTEAIRLAEKYDDEDFNKLALLADTHIESLKGYLNYSKTFIKGIHSGKVQPFPASAQVNLLKKRFGLYASDRGIKIINDIDPDLQSAPTLVTAYSGVLLNLLTNSMKAILTGKARGGSKIVFQAENVTGWHIVRVMDTGVGIPVAVRERIWDPLFSTTFEGTDALASGMGMGLPIIKRVMNNLQGEINLIDPPEGFSTCFEVRFKDKTTK